MSIRARLVLLALIAVVPAMLDRGRLLEANRVDRIAAASNEAVTLTRQGADAQTEMVIAVRSVVHVVARARATIAISDESCGRFLAGATTDAPWITGLSVIGANGRVTCSTVSNRIGLDASDRPYFQEAMTTKQFVVGHTATARTRGGVTLVGAAPIINEQGGVDGIIAAGFELQWVDRIANEISRRPNAMLLVVDDVGTILAAHPGHDKWLRKSIGKTALANEMRTRNAGSIATEGPDGTRRFFGFERLANTNAFLVIGLDEAEVLRRVDREMRMSYLRFAIIGALVLFGVWFGGEHAIVRPLRALARMAGHIGHGNLRVRATRQRWAAEFAPLANALDVMAIRLAEREEDLRVANEHLEKLTRIDGLSGLANRRGFDLKLEGEWRTSTTLGRPLAAIMIDVDYFKLFNDHYGHVEGDTCLRTVGEAIKQAAPDAVIAARYGGEEFALLLTNRDIDAALAVGETLRTAIAELRLPHAAAPNGIVTVSVGVAALNAANGDTSQTLIEAADAALYRAKHRGRNTVVGHGAIMSLAS